MWNLYANSGTRPGHSYVLENLTLDGVLISAKIALLCGDEITGIIDSEID